MITMNLNLSQKQIDDFIKLKRKFHIGDIVRLSEGIRLGRDLYTIIKIKTIRSFGVVKGKKIVIVKQWEEEGWNSCSDVLIRKDQGIKCYPMGVEPPPILATALINLAHIGSRKGDYFKNE